MENPNPGTPTPNPGVPTPMSRKNKNGCIIAAGVVGILLVLLLMIAADPEGADGGGQAAAGGQAATSEVQAPPVEVSSEEIARDFKANEVAAQQKYKGKTIAVTGKVESIELDFADDPYVLMTGSEMFQNVHIQFDDETAPKTASLTKGQKLTATCTDISEVAGSPVLSNCSF